MNYGIAKAIHTAEFTKIAAPRQIREIRRLVQEGRMEEANALAQKLQAAGVLKVTPEGTFISNPGDIGANTPEQAAERSKRLNEIRRKRMRKEELSPKEEAYLRRRGRAGIAGGAEGIADVVVGAQDRPERLAIRKTYDPEAKIYVPGQEDRKVRAGEAVQGDPRFAQFYTRDQARKNRGGYGYMIKELIEGKDIGDIDRNAIEYNRDNARAIEAQADLNKRLPPSVRVRDIAVRDVIHGGNTRVDPEGNRKIVDFIVEDEDRDRRARRGGPRYYPNIPDSYEGDLRLEDKDKSRVRQSFGGRPPPVKVIDEGAPIPPAAEGAGGAVPPPGRAVPPTAGAAPPPRAADTFPLPPRGAADTLPIPPRTAADTFPIPPRAATDVPLPGRAAASAAETVGGLGRGRALKGAAGVLGGLGLLGYLGLRRRRAIEAAAGAGEGLTDAQKLLAGGAAATAGGGLGLAALRARQKRQEQ
jgi:hypothetical protein